MSEIRRGDQSVPNPEEAYLNENVVDSLTNSDWYTPAFIQDVVTTELEPDRPLLGLRAFVDTKLDNFFLKQIDLGKGNEAYEEARLYLLERMGGVQGAPLRLGEIPFYDEEIAGYARALGVNEFWQFDRIMIFEGIDRGLMCLIAHKDIRRKVIRVLHSNNSIDVLLWSQLARKGAKQFIQERWMNK